MPKLSESAAQRGELKFVEPAIPRGALRLRDAADYLSVSVVTMHRLVKRGLIKPNRSLRTHLFPLEELKRFLVNGQ